MPPQRTHEEFVELMRQKNTNIIIRGRYEQSNTPIQCECKLDGYVWYPKPNKLLQGRGCPRCAKKEPYSESFLRRFTELHPNIELLSPFVKGDKPVRCRCKIDGYEWSPVPYSLIKGFGCPKCGGNAPYTQEEILEIVAQKSPHIRIVGDLNGTRNPVLCKCDVDGHEWMALPYHLMDGVGCPVCAGVCKKTHAAFVRELAEISPTVEVLGTYNGNKKKIRCRCKTCGHEWEGSPNALLRGHSGCVVCSQSIGEFAVAGYLNDHGISYKVQHCFPDCRDQALLRFDFYLPDHQVVIEYDGQQHFGPVQFGGATPEQAEADFHNLQRRDGIKDAYCLSHDIKMIRIPYTEFSHIAQILDKQLL